MDESGQSHTDLQINLNIIIKRYQILWVPQCDAMEGTQQPELSILAKTANWDLIKPLCLDIQLIKKQGSRKFVNVIMKMHAAKYRM